MFINSISFFIATVVSIFSGYMGSVAVVTTVKWFWFVISIATLIPVLVSIASSFRLEAAAKGGDIADIYGKLAWLTIIVWTFTPLVWLFSEGFASFSVSFEVAMYSLLDIVGKAIFGFLIMGAHETLANPSYVSPALS
jgi:bacteriorhodopsin